MRAYTKLKLAILGDALLLLLLVSLSTVFAVVGWKLALLILTLIVSLDLIAALVTYLRWR